jgi:hypothetical protein
MSASDELIVRAILTGTREYLANSQLMVGANEEMAASTDMVGFASERTAKRAWLMNQALFTARRLMYGVTLATVASGIAAVKWGWDFNSAMQAARVTLGPLQSGIFDVNSELDYLFNFTKHTPFRFSDITTAFRVMYGGMRTLGISAETVNATIRSTVDALSFAGRTSPGQLNRVAYALQHMAFQGHLTGQVVNQLGRDGIPMAAILRDQFHLTGEEIHNVGRLGIPTLQFLNEYNKWIETHKGYQGAAYRLSIHSFTGLFTTFKDNLSQLMGHIELNFFHKIQGDLANMNKWFDMIQQSAKSGNIDDVVKAIAGDGGVVMWHRIVDVLHQFWVLFSNILTILARSKPLWAFVYGGLTLLSIVLHIINPLVHSLGGDVMYLLVPAFTVWWTLTKIVAFWTSVNTGITAASTLAIKDMTFAQLLLNLALRGYFLAQALVMSSTAIYVALQVRMGLVTIWLRNQVMALWLLMELNPIVLIATAVALLIAGLVILYFKWKWFHDLVDRTWSWIIGHKEIVAAAITVAFAPLGIVLETLLHIQQIWNSLGRAWHWLSGFFGGGGGSQPTFQQFHPLKNQFQQTDPFSNNFGKGLPHAQSGGFITSPGLSWVGESGPELVHVPRGATISPLGGGAGGAPMKLDIELKAPIRLHLNGRVLADEVARWRIKTAGTA